MPRIGKLAIVWIALLVGAASAQTSRIPVGPALNGQSDAGNGTVTSVTGGNGIVIGGTTTAPTVSLPACTAAQIMIENSGATAFACNTLSGEVSITAAGVATLNMPGGTLAAHNFANALSATGTLTGAQPTVSDISGIGAVASLGVGANLQSSGGNLTTLNIGGTGTFNITDPAYGAVATFNGGTDVTTNIQSAVTAACAFAGSSHMIPEVFLPATPGTACYYHTMPIILSCNMRFNGAGWNSTALCQNYFGPSLIVQGAETGWKSPIASNITKAWIASTHYNQYKEIIDPNGNVEVATTAGTTGSGSAPAFPTSCPIVSAPCTTTDGGVTWTFAMPNTTLATGSGSAWDAVSPEFFPGAGFGSNNAPIEIGNPGKVEPYINGLAAFTVEFYFVAMVNTSVSGLVYLGPGIEVGSPGTGTAALQIYLNDAQGSCTHNCLQGSLNIGGSNVNLQPTVVGDNAATGGIHEVEVSYDGTNARLFLDGVLEKTTAASGNWTIKPYSSIMMANQNPGIYPGMQSGGNPAIAYYSSLRFSNTARHTSGFTPPTAQFTYDANTVALFNFPTSGLPIGTTEGTVNNTNAIIPIETSSGGAAVNPIYIGNMKLGDNTIYANWMLNSTIENIWNDGAGRTCIHLHDNDYQDTIRRTFCGVVPSAFTQVGYLFMNQSNNNLYEHLQCDGQYGCIDQASGSGHYIMPDMTGRGNVVYPFAFMQAQAVLDSPEADIEDSEPNELGSIYSNGGYAPVIVNGGQGPVGVSTAADFVISGGAPFIINGFDAPSAVAEVLNVITNPTSPVLMQGAILHASPTLTNSGKSFWLVAKQGNQDLGMVFADLPSCTAGLNGTSRFLTDGTPGGTCTGSGGGAKALCTGTTWGCGPSLLAGSLGLTTGGLFNATGGAVPTATCSGGSTGVSITAGSTNNRGQIVTSSSASTNCTITWSAASTWPQAPFCVFQDAAASITPTAVSTGACGTSTCVLDFASATSKTFNYLCF